MLAVSRDEDALNESPSEKEGKCTMAYVNGERSIPQ